MKMNCPKCGGLDSRKDGRKGRQRHLCKCCGYRYTVELVVDLKK